MSYVNIQTSGQQEFFWKFGRYPVLIGTQNFSSPYPVPRPNLKNFSEGDA